MKFGIFSVPYTRPGRAPYEVVEWSLQLIRWADNLGFSEAWLAEHFTIGWEPSPAPDLLIAAALRETTQITLAPGAHLLPYHQPVNLAHRVAFLDHMAKGRYMLGVGSGAFAMDRELFQTKNNNTEMMFEALDIMHGIWEAEDGFVYEGEFWSVSVPAFDDFYQGPWLKPFQKPHPPIAMAGSSPRSSTIREAGRRGYQPLSLRLSAQFLAGHWEVYEEAAIAAGRTPDRNHWRIARDFFVADTDEEAIDLAVNGTLGHQYGKYVIPSLKASGALGFMAPGRDPEEITPGFLARNGWLVGSPETVTRKLTEMHEETGGFGTLLFMASDYSDQPEAYQHSLKLLAEEVMPNVARLVPGD